MPKEIRMAAAPMQIRDGDDDHPAVIEGYALKFDRQSEIMLRYLIMTRTKY